MIHYKINDFILYNIIYICITGETENKQISNDQSNVRYFVFVISSGVKMSSSRDSL